MAPGSKGEFMDEKKYVKENKDGEVIFSLLNHKAEPGRSVITHDWELESYIKNCFYPILSCIKIMRQVQEDESEAYEYANILDRLYDAAEMQLERMTAALEKDLGEIIIRTTNEACFGSYMQQDLLEAFVEKKQIDQQSDS
jgi:hypothetical protein